MDARASAPSDSPHEKRQLHFHNGASVPADLYWDPADGAHSVRVLSDVQPGSAQVVEGFESHVYVWREPGTRRALSGGVRPDRDQLHLTREMVERAPETCWDNHVHFCAAVAARRGECASAPGWFAMNCPRACGTCMLREVRNRCHPSRFNATPALPPHPGELGALFERIVGAAEAGGHHPTVHSQPPAPWVVTLDDFVSDEEIEALLRHTLPRAARSTTQGAFSKEGQQEALVAEGRTSLNAWCQSACEAEPKVQTLTARIEALLGISAQNYESFQVLQYQKGQRYEAHLDYPRGERERVQPTDGSPSVLPAGPRLLTVFLYLSDVAKGGQTQFVDQKPPLKVTPKKGRVLIWANVLDEDHYAVDGRSLHTGLPPGEGQLKLAANAWVHLKDYRTPNLWGCTGSFEA